MREGNACGREIIHFVDTRGLEFEELLWLSEHIHGPAADYAVRGGGDDVICVLRADDGDGVDWVRVAGAGEGGFEDGLRFGAGIPDEDLTAVGTADDEVGVEGGELRGENVGLSVEDVFGAVVEVHVPDLDEAVGVVRGGGVFGVGGEDEFGEL